MDSYIFICSGVGVDRGQLKVWKVRLWKKNTKKRNKGFYIHRLLYGQIDRKDGDHDDLNDNCKF